MIGASDNYYDPSNPRPRKPAPTPEVFVLRWFGGLDGRTKGEYFQSYAAPFVSKQREAFRYSSREEALASVPIYSIFGSGGAGDTSGWKAVRLVKKS